MTVTDREQGVRRPSPAPIKVGELIRHALAEIFARGEIARRHAGDQYSLTVSEVRMTPDLKLATVFVLPLGGEGAEDVVSSSKSISASCAGTSRGAST